MALRITVGKLPDPGFRRPQWGVRGSLFAAFAVIAGMAIVISAGAGLVLGHLGVSMTDLSGRDIPRLAASLQLAAQSASLAGQGPGLLASDRKSTRLNSSHTVIYTLSLHDALPIFDDRSERPGHSPSRGQPATCSAERQSCRSGTGAAGFRSEEHTSELQSHSDLHSFPTRRSSDLR